MSQLLRPENLQDRLLFAIPKKGTFDSADKLVLHEYGY